MANINDVLKNKNNKEENQNEPKKVEVFTQLQREMIKMSILNIAMRRFQMSEMTGDKDYSDPLSQVQGAEVALENNLAAMPADARENYFAEASQRAQSEGVSVEDVMAEDAIKLKKAEMENKSHHIDPTSGRVKVEGKEEEDEEEKDKEDDYEDELDDEMQLKLD